METLVGVLLMVFALIQEHYQMKKAEKYSRREAVLWELEQLAKRTAKTQISG